MSERNPQYNVTIDVDAMLANLPQEIDRLVIKALAPHQGRELAISRRNLLDQLSPAMLKMGMPRSRLDRNLRLSIARLRKAGYPTCSTGGVGGGYFMAASLEELDAYLQIEVHARAMDLLEQEKAMRSAGERLWPAQASLL